MEAVKPKFMAFSTLDAPTAKCPSTGVPHTFLPFGINTVHITNTESEG